MVIGGKKMIRKINSNKNGVIEYAIDNVEDLNNLPRKETDNTVYAILNKDGKRLVYLYLLSLWVQILCILLVLIVCKHHFLLSRLMLF